jgi:hypothetical protein
MQYKNFLYLCGNKTVLFDEKSDHFWDSAWTAWS